MKWSLRKSLFLNDTFQKRFIAVNLIQFLVVFLIFTGTIFVPLMIQLDDPFLSWSERDKVANQFLSLHTHVWPTIAIVFVLLAIHSVLFSHRVAGPLYRFRTIFKAITEGDLTVEATTRKHDYLKHESHSINQMIVTLHTKIKGIEEQSRGMNSTVTKLQRAIDSGSASDIHQNMKSLVIQMEELQATLGYFRTTAEKP